MKQVQVSTNVGFFSIVLSQPQSSKLLLSISIPPKTLFWDSNTLGVWLICLFVFLGYYYLSFRLMAGLNPRGDLVASLCRPASFTNTFSRAVGRLWPEDNCLNHPQHSSRCALEQESQDSTALCSGNRAWGVIPATLLGSQSCSAAGSYFPCPHGCGAPLGLELSNHSLLLDCLVSSFLGFDTNFCTKNWPHYGVNSELPVATGVVYITPGPWSAWGIYRGYFYYIRYSFTLEFTVVIIESI